MKYIIIICFLLLSIACAAQDTSYIVTSSDDTIRFGSTTLIGRHGGISTDTLGYGLSLPTETNWFYQRDTVSVIIMYIDTSRDKDIHWMHGYEVKSMHYDWEYLDENKQPLNKSIVIWATK